MKNKVEQQKRSWDAMFYSMQRIDLLIISICGAGIYVILETIKYLTDNKIEIHNIIRWAGGLFLLAIVINFFSQMSGYKSNEQDYLMYQSEIDSGKKPNKKQKTIINTYDNKSECYSIATKRLNVTSIISMLIGLTLIMVYFLFIF